MAKIALKNGFITQTTAESFKAFLDCGLNGYLGYWVSLISQEYDKCAKAYTSTLNSILDKFTVLDSDGKPVQAEVESGKFDEAGNPIMEQVPNSRTFSDVEKLNSELESLNNIETTFPYDELDPTELKTIVIPPKYTVNLLWMFQKP